MIIWWDGIYMSYLDIIVIIAFYMLLGLKLTSPKDRSSDLSADSRISLHTSKANLNKRSKVSSKTHRYTDILNKLIEHPISNRLKNQLSSSYSSDRKQFLSNSFETHESPHIKGDILHFTFKANDRNRLSTTPVRLSEEEDIEWDNVVLPPRAMNISFGGKHTIGADLKPAQPLSRKRRRIVLVRKFTEDEARKNVNDQENQTDFTHSFEHLLQRPHDKIRYFTPNRVQTSKNKAVCRFPSFENHVKPFQQKHWTGRTLFSEIERLGLDGFKKMWHDKLNEPRSQKIARRVKSKPLVVNGSGFHA
jgi:hypothetical protein